MARPKRLVAHTANETLNPPASLQDGLVICRVVKAEGKNLYTVEQPDSTTLLVEMPAKFRSSIWIKRGSFVLINVSAFDERENKLGGEVQNVVGDEKVWRKMPYWPAEFPKQRAFGSSSEEDLDKPLPPEESEEDE